MKMTEKRLGYSSAVQNKGVGSKKNIFDGKI